MYFQFNYKDPYSEGHEIDFTGFEGEVVAILEKHLSVEIKVLTPIVTFSKEFNEKRLAIMRNDCVHKDICYHRNLILNEILDGK